MADGRAFTDYNMRCATQATLMQNSQFNSYELRQHLIHNADQLMDENRNSKAIQNACGPCVQPWNQGTMLKEQSQVTCTKSTCSVSTTDQNGLGQGRDYGIAPQTSLINGMESRDQYMLNNPTNVCTGYDDDLRYYTLVPVEEERYSIPSGGRPVKK
jgi:hypothetical protein